MSNVLEITTLGGLSIHEGGQPVTGLASRKAEALLVYLACGKRTRPREVLAELLWEERAQSRSLSNLRVVLSSLRKGLGPYLSISRDSVALNPDADVWLDVSELEERLATGRVEEAVELYQGDFLEGFYVRGSRGFDDWAMLERERLRQRVLDALGDLVTEYLQNGRYREGIPNARRLVQLDPYLEEAHAQLMRLLAYNGERGAALTQYEACRLILDEELGVEPLDETRALFEEIQSGKLETPRPAAPPPPQVVAHEPAFLKAARGDDEQRPRPVFVAKKRELDRLDAFLQLALEGKGGVAFVTGGAGRGKTALTQEFARRAMDAHPDLLAAAGNCNAYSGIGDPYLPFREVLAMLSGDLESRWVSGALRGEQAKRLWASVPASLDAIVGYGPQLIGRMLPAPALLSRAAAAIGPETASFAALRGAAESPTGKPDALEQSHLFRAYTDVLRALSADHPLVLLLDDMQWADVASTSLLFHLGRELGGSRILLVCAYRPDEVSLGRDGSRHPLEKVLAESKRQSGDVWLDLARVKREEGYGFVEALIDSEPNCLGAGFREALFHHTEGHPLFTVELLRAMQDRGILVRDGAGRWTLGDSLDWGTLPPKVEGVVEERIGRLDDDLRDILLAASVEGESFTAQVAARVQGVGERQILRALSGVLQQRHRLVAERGEIRIGGERLSLFQFTHRLFQTYLYNSLSGGERRLLHGEIATELESLYRGHTGEISVPLSRHFQEADMADRAVVHLLRAGDQARALYAHDEAERFYQDAVAILHEQGEHEQAARTLMKLGLVHTSAFQPERARDAYERAFSLWEPLREPESLASLEAQGAVLRFAVEEPSTLVPGAFGDDVSTFIASQLFEGLVRVGQDYNVLPAAANRWDVNDDGRRYLFHLRGGALWSDGTPLTAGDFEYAWKRHLQPSSGSPVADLLHPIRNARAFREGEKVGPETVGVTALDDLTLEVRLEAPTAYLPYLLAQTIAFPLPRWALERHGEEWIRPGNLVCNGPYQLADWTRGEKLVLSRNPYYQGRFPGNAERIECLVFPDHDAALDAYSANEVDAVSMLNADQLAVSRAMADFGAEVVVVPRPSTLYLMFRVDKPPFDDVQVRRAFVHAVDRETLSRQAFSDRRLPATGGFIPPGMPGHSPEIGLPYDPAEARDFLAKAGYPDGDGFPVISWHHPIRTPRERVIPFLRNAWSENLGVDLESEGLAWGELLERIATDPAHLTVISWGADFPDPAGMLRVTFHSKEGVSNPRWHHARFDAMLEEAEQVTDHARRMELYQAADCILIAEEVVTMPLTYGRGRMLVKPWVQLPPAHVFPLSLRSVTLGARGPASG